MGLRIIRNRRDPDEFDLRMVEWETLLARDGERWAEWRLTNSEELKATLRKKIRHSQTAGAGAEEQLKQLLRVETNIKQLQNIKAVHGQKNTDSKTILDLL